MFLENVKFVRQKCAQLKIWEKANFGALEQKQLFDI